MPGSFLRCPEERGSADVGKEGRTLRPFVPRSDEAEDGRARIAASCEEQDQDSGEDWREIFHVRERSREAARDG